MQKKFYHPDWGLTIFKKNKRSKRLTIRVKDEAVVVTLPWLASYTEAERLLTEHRDWVQAALKKRQAHRDQQRFDWDLSLKIAGKQVVLTPQEQGRSFIQHQDQCIEIALPANVDWSDDGAQAQLKHLLVEAMRWEAKAYLPARTRELAAQYNIAIHKIFIKNVKTRWGSCSSKGNINLSLHLMLLPYTWMDYVITHELAHIRHPNHSPAFWAHLEALMPGAKAIDQLLNGYRRPF